MGTAAQGRDDAFLEQEHMQKHHCGDGGLLPVGESSGHHSRYRHERTIRGTQTKCSWV